MKKNMIPPPNSGRIPKYGFNKLKKYGDFVKIMTKDFHAVRDAAYKHGIRYNIKMATRKFDEGMTVYHAGFRPK